MESLPLIPKSFIVPNLDVTPLIREIFQTEFESYVPSKKLSENLKRSLEYEEDFKTQKSYRSMSFLENLSDEKDKLMDYAENVLEAYGKHEKALNRISKVELNIMETQAIYLRREKIIEENDFLRDLLLLKRHPMMKAYNPEYVKRFKLLQGDSGLPPKHEVEADFRVKDYHKWMKRLSSISNDSLLMGYINKKCCETVKKSIPKQLRKERVKRPKQAKTTEQTLSFEIFRPEPKFLYFTDYTPGEEYQRRVVVKNVGTKPMRFILKPLPAGSPFKAVFYGTETTRILPGFSFKLLVTFLPRTLDEENESIILLIEDGTKVVIPVACFLEPPLLKTHEELDHYTKNISEKIRSSYIDCGACLLGDSKVTKIRFHSFGGVGEFFIMSQDNWSNWHVNCLTMDNFTELPPFRCYPTYFKVEKNEVMDLFVEFKPPASGMHSDNIVIVCNNGEARNMDIIGDGIAWSKSFITIQETLEKDFPAHIDDDPRAMYYIDMGVSPKTGRKERRFQIANHSIMPFEFRWEMREALIPSILGYSEEPGKLSRMEVRVEPSTGIIGPCSSLSFLVSVTFTKKPVKQYRTILSLYIIGLPYQSIEEASTIIRPSLLRGRFKSESFSGEEDNLLLSPEFSLQGTYESIQEGMRSSSEEKYQQSFPYNVCRKHPSICAMPLKRSKTYSNIGESADTCVCSTPDAVEVTKNCDFDWFQKKPHITELGSELLWDFVDVLVDEIELWAEVLPSVLTVEPCIISLNEPVRLNEPPVEYKVTIQNRNDFQVRCKWLSVKNKIGFEEPMSTLYHFLGTHQSSDTESGNTEFSELSCETISGPSLLSLESVANYQVACWALQRCPLDGDPNLIHTVNCNISIEPKGVIVLPPQSFAHCTVNISSTKPGYIYRVLYLAVEDEDEPCEVHIRGMTVEEGISLFPTLLDFGSVKSGARYTRHFKIQNLSRHPIEWYIEEYRVDYANKCLAGPIAEDEQTCLQNVRGVIEEGDCTVESYKLNARKPGLQTSILRFMLMNADSIYPTSTFILVLADVHEPKLAIETLRFQNAILAPNRTMYVGQKLTQSIILRNMKNFTTSFMWGNSFGCHCRKLEIIMHPNVCNIGAMKKIVVQVEMVPLEEGIVEHCYIPCFFSRRVNPVILSIIGIIRSAQVTFEISTEGGRICSVAPEEVTSFINISWPIKNFDSIIGLNHINQHDIFDFNCHCAEVEAAYERATNLLPQVSAATVEMEIPVEEEYQTNLSDAREEAEGEEVEEENQKKCMKKNYTSQRLIELTKGTRKRTGISFAMNTLLEDEVDIQKGEEGKSENKETDTDTGALVGYPKRECIELLYYAASEMVFLNVRYKTVAVKHFRIRNESPISAKFALRVRYFAKANQFIYKNRMEEIRKRVFGRDNGEFEESMVCGQPLLIMTSPSEGTLDGWENITVTVYVYGNTWGEYRDFIVCDIDGMPPFVMKVFVQLSGHPLLFPMFSKTLLDTPVLRFNTIKYKSQPVTRKIKVRNTSSIPMTVTWMIFLTSPISEEVKDDPFNLCLDFYTDRESEDQEKTTKSSHNYLSKNTSGSAPILEGFDMDKTSSRWTGMEPNSEMDSAKKSGLVLRSCESEVTPTTQPDSTKPEVQLLENFGKLDLHVFQISPRELHLEPYSDEKMIITFDPSYYDQTNRLQEFEAVATGCVRLKQEYAHYPEIYNRPCGKDYVSKLLQITASVERPTLSFNIFQSDLVSVIFANDVLSAKEKELRIRKKCLVLNQCQTEISTIVRVEPGELFCIKMFGVFGKVLPNKALNIEPGQSVEVHLEACITQADVMNMFRKMELNRAPTKNTSESSELLLEGQIKLDQSDSDTRKSCQRDSRKYSSWSKSLENLSWKKQSYIDGMKVIGHHSRRWKSVSSIDEKGTNLGKEFPEEFPFEWYGEGLEVGPMELPNKSKQGLTEADIAFTHEEDIVFEQVGSVSQVLTPVLKIFFPCFKVDPEVVYFGSVWIGENSHRYASIRNLTQFPTEFRVTWTGELDGFSLTPCIGRLPASNQKSDNGVELTVNFKPEKPGFFWKYFKIYGNKEMKFHFCSITVIGYGTWNEKWRYPKHLSASKQQSLTNL